MSEYRFTLEKYSGPRSRHKCPSCGRRRSFTRYIEKDTDNYLDAVVGRCNRESKCGYHYKPSEYFLEHGIPFKKMMISDRPRKVNALPKPISFMPNRFLENSLKTYQRNNFALFLISLVGLEAAKVLLRKYHVGTTKFWPGGTVFWQVDKEGKIRTGKLMLYDCETGRRVKQPYHHIHWAHRFLNDTNFNLEQCLFGEHLLIQEPYKPVIIVESEKSAIIACHFFPHYLWLACGGLSNLSSAKCQVLRGRQVILIPDLGAFNNWKKKTEKLQDNLQVNVSSALEVIAKAQEREAGWDIADYLIEGRVKDIDLRRLSIP